MGVGFLETTVRGWLGYQNRPVNQDWRRYLTASEDHKVIGLQYLATFVVVLLTAGVGAMMMRIQLSQPANTFLSPDIYNRVMSFHGIAMVSVAVAAVMGSFGNYFVPIMIGARDMAFPRLNALSFWLIPVVIVSLFLSEFLGGWDSGWTAYPPLSVKNAAGQVMFNLAIIVFGLSSIFGGINFLVTIDQDAGAGHDLGPRPDLRVVGVRRRVPRDVLHPVLRREPHDGPAGPHRRHQLLRGPGRRPAPLRAHLLVLLAPGGVHLRAAGLRHGARGPGAHVAQAAVRLPLGGGGASSASSACRGSCGRTTCSCRACPMRCSAPSS